MPQPDLVVFGEDFGRHPSSTQHLIRELARGRKILYVNSIGMRRPRLNPADLGRVWSKLMAMLGRRRKSDADRVEVLPPGLTVLAPRAIPWPGSNLADRINRLVLGRQIRGAMAQLGIHRPILWLSLPSAVSLLGVLDAVAVVYYCGDDFGALDGVDHKPVLRQEAILVARADLILAVSPALARRFPTEKTTLIPHGVDLDRFTQPAPRAPDLPAGLVAGYYGNICERLDQALLATVAQGLPNWRFVLIGERRVPTPALDSLPNLVFLGPRHHAELPGYVQHWTASILPFRDTAMVRASNPLKLREYLAAGRPIVATPMPALDPYADLIAITAQPRDFIDGLIAAASDPPVARSARQARIRGESWQARAAEVAALLGDLS